MKRIIHLLLLSSILHNVTAQQAAAPGKVMDTAGSHLSSAARPDSLEAVTVTGNRSLITRKVDRVIMNVDNNPLAAGKSSLELFRLAPGVMVQNGDITINGITHAMIMVNGRLLRLSGRELANYLNTLRAEEIERIEIIPNPPAEYDASAGGLINIVLKRQKKNGLSGSVSSTYEQGKYPGFRESTQLSYKQDKLTLSGSYSRNWDYSYSTTSNVRTSETSDYRYSYEGFKKDSAYGERVRVGAVYDIGKGQYVGIDYTHSRWHENAPFHTLTTISDPDAAPSLLNGIFPQDTRSGFNNAGFNYSVRLDTAGTMLTLLTDYTWNTSSDLNSAFTDYADEDGNYRDTSYRNIIGVHSHVYSADLEVTRPVSKAATVSLGGKLVEATIGNAVDFDNYTDADWIKIPAQSYQYTYKENIYAGFANYEGRVFHLDVKAGLRGEYTTTDGALLSQGVMTDNKNSYFGFFPSVFLQKVLNGDAGNSLSLSARRGIYRPDYSQLDPFVIYVDNYTTEQGNPYLKPQYANDLQLQYTFRNDYSAAFIYQRANDVIFTILNGVPGDSLRTYYSPVNLATRDDYIVMLSAPLKLSKWWSMDNTFIFKQERLDAGSIQYDKPAVFLQTSQDFSLPAGYRLSVNGTWRSALMQGNIDVGGYYRVDLGVQRAFWKKRLTARLNVNDLFNTEAYHTNVAYDGYLQRGYEKTQTRSVVLQLIYNFKAGKAFTVKRLSRSNEEESGRLGVK